MQLLIVLISVFLFSLPAISENLEGVWTVTTPEGAPVELFISMTLGVDSTLTMVQELPGEEAGQTVRYIISGFWVSAENTIQLHQLEATGQIGDMVVKDEEFEPTVISGIFECPAADRLILHLSDENGTEYSLFFSRASTSVRPIEWAKIKARFHR